MIAFNIHQPRTVLVLGGALGAIRLRWSRFQRNWCGGLKGVLRARREGRLVDVAEVRFDAAERRWRVERDELGRDVLVIGAAVALMLCLTDESDRWMHEQMQHVFGDRHWLAHEAAQAAAVMSERIGLEVERAAL